MSFDKAIILVSGGMDSLVTAAIASREYELAFLHINYGQRTEKRELKSFNDIADHYNVAERLMVNIDYLAKIGGSSLTDKSIEVSKANIHNQEVPTSYVPFRNANILAIAVSWAEVIGAKKIFIGAVEEDSSGYPDCREVFYDAFNKMISLGTKPDTNIKIESPIIHMKKYEIIMKGALLNAPFRLSWSCYQNEEKACGECDSCALRLKGFQEAGLVDPIDYVIRPLYKN
ncbi:MAG TPA: 7-cyano-7-deazaguanine synthase QueC [Ignavibacteria bacterium]|nr:7-cyano-7-deazaguanine synthase QueC [Ignavibacteria bacterium]HMR00005.1 7-cyano-7-deazaguanine synthase QueC [Ignavibacteria bacterium]